MIKFQNNCDSEPYKLLRYFYDLAEKSNQESIDAFLISSYSMKNKEVDARFVNLKFVIDKDFIFFSNYESPKAMQFRNHNQVAAVIYWNSINTQVRLKGKIEKTSKDFNQNYFKSREKHKNALAISSKQSLPVKSYNLVKENYNNILSDEDLTICPEYWGGFSLRPYYFEFWEGNNSRINKRVCFKNIEDEWQKSLLQP